LASDGSRGKVRPGPRPGRDLSLNSSTVSIERRPAPADFAKRAAAVFGAGVYRGRAGHVVPTLDLADREHLFSRGLDLLPALLPFGGLHDGLYRTRAAMVV